jgi:transposase-like protein
MTPRKKAARSAHHEPARDRSPREGAGAEDRTLPESVACPFCASSETEVFSPFGSAASVAQYYCRGCRTVFEYLKWEASR